MTSPGPRGIPLGRVFGARVLVQPSTIVLALVLALYFGSAVEGLTRRSFTLGLAVAISLFVAVFLHEVAHAAAARAFKREVEHIVLTFMGGHTQFRAPDPRPLEIGVISAAGPVANVVLGALSGIVAQFLTGVPGMVVGAFAWMNLLLAAFNALPGTPLDGGRVLTAIVWGATGDRLRGHRAAAWGGRIVAIAVVVGVIAWPVLRGQAVDFVSLIWGMLLFSVIWPAASAELRAATVMAKREGVTAMAAATPAVAVPYDVSVAEARHMALQEGAGEVIVLSADGQAAGHFALAVADSVPEGERGRTPLSAVLMPLPRGAQIEASLAGEDLVQAVLPWLTKVSILTVVDQGVPVAVVTVEDLKRLLG